MKKLFTFSLLLCLTCSMFAQTNLRNSVCLVLPEISEEEKTLFDDYSLALSRANMSNLSRQLMAYQKGVTGSGVVVRVSQGDMTDKLVVVTNLHVVRYAKQVTIEFHQGREKTTYEHCAVLGYSTTTDLAFIELPQADFYRPISIADLPADEGADVVAAGFPALNGKPSWQMTKGTISNAELYDADLLGDTIPAIQHTAAIDPGSSGGPLLVENQPHEYRIVGINTWGVHSRSEVGIAIPAAQIHSLFIHHDPALSLSEQITLPSIEWTRLFLQLPQDTADAFNKDDYDHPMQFVKRVTDYADRHNMLTDKQKNGTSKNNKTIAINPDRNWYIQFGLGYQNFLSAHNQTVHIAGEMSMTGYGLFGVQLGVRMQDAVVYENPEKLLAGLYTNIYTGVQVPIQINDYMLVPRITFGGGVGPIGRLSEYSILLPHATGKTGVNFRLPIGSVEMQLGLHYVCEFPMAIDGRLSTNGVAIKNIADKGSAFKCYIQHGLELTVMYCL